MCATQGGQLITVGVEGVDQLERISSQGRSQGGGQCNNNQGNQVSTNSSSSSSSSRSLWGQDTIRAGSCETRGCGQSNPSISQVKSKSTVQQRCSRRRGKVASLRRTRTSGPAALVRVLHCAGSGTVHLAAIGRESFRGVHVSEHGQSQPEQASRPAQFGWLARWRMVLYSSSDGQYARGRHGGQVRHVHD